MACSIEEKLPEELLDYIISLTAWDSLPQLCLVSKTINRLATPHLYADIHLKDFRIVDLPAFAYLMFTSPSHATLVKSLVILDTWPEIEEPSKEWAWPCVKGPHLETLLRKKCTQYTFNDKESFDMYKKLESGTNNDAILAFLLVSLPGLQRLNINFGIGKVHIDFVTMWPAIMNRITSISGSALHLSDRPQTVNSTTLSVPIDVMVPGAETRYSDFTVYLATLIQLPNLRSIYALKLGDNEEDPDPETNAFAKLKPRSCPVEYIEMRISRLHMLNFQYLLDATIPGKLKSFSYEVGNPSAWCDTDHQIIMESLQPHHNSLTALSLSHEDYYPYKWGHESDRPCPCSFVAFSALERLQVAPVYIWGHEGFTDKARLKTPETIEMLINALPKNLSELWIAKAHHQEIENKDPATEFVPKYLLPAIELVVQSKSKSFPKIESLRIELRLLDWETEWFDDLASLCRKATANGIQSTIILHGMLDRYGDLVEKQRWGWNEDVDWEPSCYSTDRQCARIWVKAAEQQDLAQTLRDLRARFEEERRKLDTAIRELVELGYLCWDCQRDPAYKVDNKIDLDQIVRFVEERLGTKSCWNGS